MKRGLLASFLWLLLIFPAGAEMVTFAEFSLGVGVQTIEDDGEEKGAVTQVTKVAGGVQPLPFITASAGLWFWDAREAEKEENEEQDGTHPNLEFYGVSASWDVTLKVPFDNDYSSLAVGPYYRYGHHCWSAAIDGLVQPWAKKGCSALQSFGVLLPSVNEEGASVYFEITATEFDEVDSTTLQVGVMVPY